MTRKYEHKGGPPNTAPHVGPPLFRGFFSTFCDRVIIGCRAWLQCVQPYLCLLLETVDNLGADASMDANVRSALLDGLEVTDARLCGV